MRKNYTVFSAGDHTHSRPHAGQTVLSNLQSRDSPSRKIAVWARSSSATGACGRHPTPRFSPTRLAGADATETSARMCWATIN